MSYSNANLSFCATIRDDAERVYQTIAVTHTPNNDYLKVVVSEYEDADLDKHICITELVMTVKSVKLMMVEECTSRNLAHSEFEFEVTQRMNDGSDDKSLFLYTYLIREAVNPSRAALSEHIRKIVKKNFAIFVGIASVEIIMK